MRPSRWRGRTAIPLLGLLVGGGHRPRAQCRFHGGERLPVRDVRLTVRASGDLLVHAPVAAAAATSAGDDLRPLLAPIQPFVRRSDIALCHAETPIGAGARSGYPLFDAPAELAPALRSTRFDACSTASNHSVDRGVHGIAATLASLLRAGLRATGTARAAHGARRILLLRRKGVAVALLSYTDGTNGVPVPAPVVGEPPLGTADPRGHAAGPAARGGRRAREPPARVAARPRRGARRRRAAPRSRGRARRAARSRGRCGRRGAGRPPSSTARGGLRPLPDALPPAR